MKYLNRKICVLVLSTALTAPIPALAGAPMMLAQFFESFDDEPETPPGDDSPSAQDPGLEGFDFDGLGDSGIGGSPERAPGWASGETPGSGDADVAGSVPPVYDSAERSKLLEKLYTRLSQAKTSNEASRLTDAIEELWAMSGSDTVDLLMSRATQFANDSDIDLSLAVLDAIVDIAPDEAEAWYLRAKVNVLAGKPERALIDLRRALSVDEKHYLAMTDLGLVLEQLGAKKEALKAYRQALAINPFIEDAKAGADALSREVEGQDI